MAEPHGFLSSSLLTFLASSCHCPTVRPSNCQTVFTPSPNNQPHPSGGTQIKASAHLDIGCSVLDIGYSVCATLTCLYGIAIGSHVDNTAIG